MSETTDKPGTAVTEFKLNPIEETKLKLEKLADDYRTLLVNEETFDEAKKARVALRDERYAIQHMQDANNKQINSLKAQNKENAESLIAIIFPVEDRIDKEIKAIEAVQENIKLQKAKAEQERKQKIEDNIAAFDRSATEATLRTKTSAELQVKFTELSAWEISEAKHMEFYPIANAKRKQLLDAMQERIMELTQEETAEATRKLEADRIAEDQRKERERLDAIAEENRKEREKLDAQQRQQEQKAKEIKMQGRVARLLSVGVIEVETGFQIVKDTTVQKVAVEEMDDDTFENKLNAFRELIAETKAAEEKKKQEVIDEQNRQIAADRLQLKKDQARARFESLTFAEMNVDNADTFHCADDVDVNTVWNLVYSEKRQAFDDEQQRIREANEAKEKELAEVKRIESMKPDVDKINEYLHRVRVAVKEGETLNVSTVDAKTWLTQFVEGLEPALYNINAQLEVVKPKAWIDPVFPKEN